MEKLNFDSVEHKLVLNKSVKQSVVKWCKNHRVFLNRWVRDAMREKADRDGIEYEEYEETGQQLSGHPDKLCVSRDRVVAVFPETESWPVKGDHTDRFGCVLGNGVYLFPDFDFKNPSFEAV